LTKLRIVFLIKALAAGPGGGAERILALISSALADRGHEVSVLTFDRFGSRDFYSVGADVHRVCLGVGATHQSSGLAATAKRVIRIRDALRTIRPEVAVGFMHSAFVPLGIAALGTGIPVIGSERTSFAHYRTRPLQRLLLRASIPLLKAMTVNGERVRSGFPRALAAKMRVIPNPVIKSCRFADPGGGRVKTLLSIGVLRPEKDHRTLLFAFAQITDRFPDWRLKIVGGGPLYDALKQQIRELNLGRVDLPGATARVEEEYCNAQLFVLPSRYEAFPNCVAEALAHGLPAVGFADCPGTNALIIPGVNGELAHGRDRTAALSIALERLMASASERRRLAAAAPSTVERYSLASVAAQWEDFVLEIASHTGSRSSLGGGAADRGRRQSRRRGDAG
jgi:GalNAc-alpha-(1->4)-GalNAc-alpha-(1->3)-diNAcBac-PP-undecaprenol alpha-1,4-N-acetyl-D-galactosaminyltransferase